MTGAGFSEVYYEAEVLNIAEAPEGNLGLPDGFLLAANSCHSAVCSRHHRHAMSPVHSCLCLSHVFSPYPCGWRLATSLPTLLSVTIGGDTQQRGGSAHIPPAHPQRHEPQQPTPIHQRLQQVGASCKGTVCHVALGSSSVPAAGLAWKRRAGPCSCRLMEWGLEKTMTV